VWIMAGWQGEIGRSGGSGMRYTLLYSHVERDAKRADASLRTAPGIRLRSFPWLSLEKSKIVYNINIGHML